jgi:hypothetical protein
MKVAIVSACVAFGLVHFSPAALGSTAEVSTEYGASAVFQGESVRAFISHDGQQIQSFGVEVPAALYDKAPVDPPSDGLYDVPVDAEDPGQGMAWYCCGYEIVVPIPASATELTPFREVVLNWNPKGHVPPFVYDVPHTDFHFYFMSDEERLTIGGAHDSSSMCTVPNFLGPEPPMLPIPQNCEQLAVTGAVLPADQMPPGYQNLGLTEPAMGNHLVDPAFHEFHGMPFDHTLIYMTNAGRLTGMEPMISLAFMRSLDGPVRVPISMPAAFPVAGMYPTEYVVEYDREGGLFRVSYETWKPFPASGALTASAATQR